MSDIRAFISIPVPDTAPLEPLIDGLSGVRGVRTSPLSQLHITLCFIGDVDESKVSEIEDCVRKAADGIGPFRVSVTGVGAFPKRDRPSVIWVGAEPERTLTELSTRIGANLDAAGIGRDRKPFKSHITIARCRSPANLSEFFSHHDKEEVLSFECEAVLVMRSQLGPGGAKHTVLRRVSL